MTGYYCTYTTTRFLIEHSDGEYGMNIDCCSIARSRVLVSSVIDWLNFSQCAPKYTALFCLRDAWMARVTPIELELVLTLAELGMDARACHALKHRRNGTWRRKVGVCIAWYKSLNCRTWLPRVLRVAQEGPIITVESVSLELRGICCACHASAFALALSMYLQSPFYGS